VNLKVGEAMKSKDKAEREEEGLKAEDFMEDLWRDFYDSKCKLMRSRKPMSLDELFFTQEG